ncbi:hypothetical protein V500_00150 [Pseudogymnoascus sp. VKM F-4518 (FW-2643)]|nr:hypothetical protein V500_00150 [Pseudogymnoascus sp. VKM F-4518 (FW-2643)]
MVSPKYENGQVVFYKPIGGPNSETSESTGIITGVLTQPGQQANVQVTASAAQPRFKTTTPAKPPCWVGYCWGEEGANDGKRNGKSEGQKSTGKWRRREGAKSNVGKERRGEGASGRRPEKAKVRKGAGKERRTKRGKEQRMEMGKERRQEDERSREGANERKMEGANEKTKKGWMEGRKGDHVDLVVGRGRGRAVADDDALVGEVHLGGEGGVGDPLVGGAGGGLLEHLVDLLQGEALGLGDEEVGEGEGDAAEGAPHEEDLGAEVGLALLGTDETYAVPEPVGGGGETDTARADGQREDLADDDPGAGAPGGGEEGDVDADEGDHGLDGTLVVLARGASGDTDDTDDELRNDHAHGTDDENTATAEALDDPEGERGAQDVDEGGHEGDEEGVVDRAEGGEKDGSEVEDEVDTSQLLHHLEDYAEDRAADIGGALEDGAVEAVGPALEVGGLRDDLHLVLVVGDDLGELVLDVVGVNWLATNGCEGLGGALELALLDEETGRLGQEEETSREDDGPQELHGDGDTVGSGIIAALGGVDNAVGEEDTDGDAELVTGHEGTADLLGRDLGHVQNDDGGDESDTETGDQATHDHDGKGGGGSLQDGTDREDAASHDNGWATTNEIGDVASGDGTEEGTAGQNRSHERLITGSNVEGGLVREEGVRFGIGAKDVDGVGHAGVLADEERHGEHTSHPSGIISEEDATKGREGTHEWVSGSKSGRIEEHAEREKAERATGASGASGAFYGVSD